MSDERNITTALSLAMGTGYPWSIVLFTCALVHCERSSPLKFGVCSPVCDAQPRIFFNQRMNNPQLVTYCFHALISLVFTGSSGVLNANQDTELVQKLLIVSVRPQKS